MKMKKYIVFALTLISSSICFAGVTITNISNANGGFQNQSVKSTTPNIFEQMKQEQDSKNKYQTNENNAKKYYEEESKNENKEGEKETKKYDTVQKVTKEKKVEMYDFEKRKPLSNPYNKDTLKSYEKAAKEKEEVDALKVYFAK